MHEYFSDFEFLKKGSFAGFWLSSHVLRNLKISINIDGGVSKKALDYAKHSRKAGWHGCFTDFDFWKKQVFMLSEISGPLLEWVN